VDQRKKAPRGSNTYPSHRKANFCSRVYVEQKNCTNKSSFPV
jgi:hypothetical protein